MTSEELAQTHAAAFSQTRPWSAEEFESLLSQTGVILCGDAKSFVLGRVIAGEAEVLTLATHPDYQQQGLAQTQLETFLVAAKAAGADCVFLEVAADNAPATNLYLKNEFENNGHRPHYYLRQDGTKIGADVLRRAL
ncbi:MAG: GNAT family N-acetyltransferase [Yoonia sp.]|nr:GNAT family N-acetyltransferase [Yoonia sp.]